MPRLVIANDRNRVMTDLSVAQAVEVLRADRGATSFVRDLVRDYDRYGDRLSPGKKAWVMVIGQQTIDRRSRAEQPREALGNFDAIAKLFRLAGTRLKFPKVELDTADGRTVVLALAGERSRYAGRVRVSSGHKFGDPDGRFYGWIDRDVTTGVSDREVLVLLRRFAADPAGIAAEYGRRVGQCCFCRLGLTDERSLLVGYGPKCADNYSLPWGSRPDASERHGLPGGDRPAGSTGGQPELPFGALDGERDRPTDFQIEQQARERRERASAAQFAALERRRELEGFASDPDYSGFRASEGPSRALDLDGLLGAAVALAVRDGYLPPTDERAPAPTATWRDDD